MNILIQTRVLYHIGEPRYEFPDESTTFELMTELGEALEA
jgi:hypothetical protein